MSEKTCIIIPCFNEAERFKTEEFLYFLEKVSGIDFCFVNDGSTDHTAEVLEKVCSAMPGRMFVVNYPDNRGKAEAVRRGMNHVLGMERYRWVGFADADLATPLEEIYRLVRILEQETSAVIVIGSRVKRMGVAIERKLFRHYMGRLFATVVAILFRFNAYDTQCGAKIFTRDIARSIFEKVFISSWLFDVEILLRVKKLRSDYNEIVKEIPLNVWMEQGNSRIRLCHLLKMPLELWKIYFRYKS